MLETGIRQLRMARSLIWGGPISSDNVRRLVGDALRTLEEFGTPGDDVQQLLDGPFADPNLRESFQTRALRRTARRAAAVTPFYRELFAKAGLVPGGRQGLAQGSQRHVLLSAPGENQLLLRLDRYLAAARQHVAQALAREMPRG